MPMKILVVKLGALGDVINTFPAVSRIKNHFHADIHWLVAPLSYDFVSGHRSVDRVIQIEKGKKGSVIRTLKQIREVKYDLAIDFQRTLKSGFFCLMSRSLMKLGFDRERCKEMTYLYPFTRIPSSDPHKHMLYQYMDFADFLGAGERDITWDLNPIGEKRREDLPDNYIILNIGATKKVNLWKADQFARLSDLLKEKMGIDSVLTGGPEDRTRSEEIAGLVTFPVVNLCGQTTLLELRDVLYHSLLVVSCDTGPMHLSVALGKKTVALFGPSDPKRTGPFRGDVIYKTSECAPCNRRRCKEPFCMDLIKAEDVLTKIESVIEI